MTWVLVGIFPSSFNLTTFLLFSRVNLTVADFISRKTANSKIVNILLNVLLFSILSEKLSCNSYQIQRK